MATKSRSEVLRAIGESGLICILRDDDEEGCLRRGLAAAKGGVSVLEVSLTTPGAEKVIAEDDIVDDWFDRVKHTLIRRMTTDPGEGERAVDLLMIAKYFERIGDHAVNVAQWVIFSVTGMHKEG